MFKRAKVRCVFIILLQIIALFVWGGYKYITFEGYVGSYKDCIFSVYGNIDSEKGGYFVDESFGKEGIFTCGPYAKLKKGIYQVTVLYKAIGTGHTCVAYDEDAEEIYANGIKSDTIMLNENQTVKSFTIWVERDLNYFEIQTHYGGNGSLLIKEILIEEKVVGIIKPIAEIALLLLIVNGVVLFLYAIKMKWLKKQSIFVGAGLCVIILLVSSPAFRKGLVEADVTDFNFVLMRIEGLKDGMLSGQFPVRIQPNWLNGYGYATSIFYGDLLLIFPAMLRILGFTIQDAWNIYSVCINAITCLMAYFCFKGIFKDRIIGFVGSTLFSLSSYRIMHMVASPKGGILLAYMMLPLVIYGVYLIYYEGTIKKGWIMLAIGMTGILQSHLLTSVVVGFVIAVLILLSIRRFFNVKRVVSMIKAVCLAIVLNIGFFVPLLDYSNDGLYVFSEGWGDYIQKKGVELSEYFNIFKSGDASCSVADVLLIIGMFAFAVILLVVPRDKLSEELRIYREIGIVSTIIVLLLLFMSTRHFPWDCIEDIFPFLRGTINSIQFPARRIQGVAIAILTIIMCIDLKVLQKYLSDYDFRLSVVVVIGITCLTATYQVSCVLNNSNVVEVYDLAGLDVNRISTKEYLMQGANPELYISETAIPSEGVEIFEFNKDKLDINILCRNNLKGTSVIEVPLTYYKGYVATDSMGKELDVACSEKYTVQVVLPGEYEGNIHIWFREPVSWTISFWISVFFALVLVGIQIVLMNKERMKQNNLLS